MWKVLKEKISLKTPKESAYCIKHSFIAYDTIKTKGDEESF